MHAGHRSARSATATNRVKDMLVAVLQKATRRNSSCPCHPRRSATNAPNAKPNGQCTSRAPTIDHRRNEQCTPRHQFNTACTSNLDTRYSRTDDARGRGACRARAATRHSSTHAPHTGRRPNNVCADVCPTRDDRRTARAEKRTPRADMARRVVFAKM